MLSFHTAYFLTLVNGSSTYDFSKETVYAFVFCYSICTAHGSLFIAPLNTACLGIRIIIIINSFLSYFGSSNYSLFV